MNVGSHAFMIPPDPAAARAILTRAATVEAARQAARERCDFVAMRAAEYELGNLWQAFAALGDDP